MRLKCTGSVVIGCVSLMYAASTLAQEASTGTPENVPRPLVYHFGQDFLRESNVLRLSDGIPLPAAYAGNGRGDTISRTFGDIAYTNNIGTQSISATANLEFRKYQSYTGLNRTNYGLGLNWNGDLGPAWYAAMGVTASAITSEFSNQFGLETNIGRNLGVNGRLGYRFSPTWSAYAGLSNNRRSNSAASLLSSDVNQRSIEFGGRYEPGTGLSGELALVRRNVDFPTAQTVDAFGIALPGRFDNSYVATQLVARANYQPTGQSSFIGSVGLSNSRFNTLKQRDSSGVILGLTYRHVYSDLLSFGVRLNRDVAGDQLSFSSPVESTRLGLDASWRATGRITVNGAYEINRRRFNADAGVVLGTSALDADRIQSMNLNASYELLRTVRLTAGVVRASRHASVINVPYSGTTATIGVDVRLD